jgi:hypothetical protein
MTPVPITDSSIARDRATAALEAAWGIIANAGRNLRESAEDGWPHESAEWVEAAMRWRDEHWHPWLDATRPARPVNARPGTTHRGGGVTESERILRDALTRLADWTEMAGVGDLESMTGPAKAELRTRIKYAEANLRKAYRRPTLVDPT